MDTRIKICLILITFFIILIILGINERNRIKTALYKKIEKEFGKSRKNGYSLYAKKFFDNHREAASIDDITASDLDLDNVFSSINHTYSLLGEQYLYYRLRTPVFNKELINKNEESISYFADKSRRNMVYDFLYLFSKLGKKKNTDLASFFDENKGKKNSVVLHILCYLLYALSIFLIIYHTGTGIIALIISFIFAITLYFKEKTGLLQFINPAFYIIKLIKTAQAVSQKLSDNDCTGQMKEYSDEMKNICKNLNKVCLGSSYVFLSADDNKNIASIIIDYVNMIFHFDILLYFRIEKGLLNNTESINRLIEYLGKIESDIALASYRESLESWCVPSFDTESSIKNLYHPLMNRPVKNDGNLNDNMLITGSNASGKSTYLKALALSVLMAETVGTVCADKYNVPFYRIYTSMALRDNLQNGESFFMAEIKSIKRIIDRLSESEIPVICFIDEILKGTNTVERIAASSQITRFLDDNSVRCIFATHDIELAGLLEGIVNNVHFEEDLSEKDVVFTYQLKEGPSKSRNAIRLLKHLGYDNSLTENAAEMANHYENSKEWLMIK